MELKIAAVNFDAINDKLTEIIVFANIYSDDGAVMSVEMSVKNNSD